jgi:hypothetical protein
MATTFGHIGYDGNVQVHETADGWLVTCNMKDCGGTVYEMGYERAGIPRPSSEWDTQEAAEAVAMRHRDTHTSK